jgi:hypothetical protein
MQNATGSRNMLVGTEGGETFTFEEFRDDLRASGFIGAKVARHDEGMNSVVVAQKRKWTCTDSRPDAATACVPSPLPISLETFLMDFAAPDL